MMENENCCSCGANVHYDFDSVIDRRGTGCTKVDDLAELFGTSELLPLWIADMDFAVCPDITRALQQRLAHPIYGYASPGAAYWQSIISWLDHRHHFTVTREEINYVPGVVKGIAMALNFFTSPGDKVVIQPPVYHPFKMVIEGNKRVVCPNPLLRTEDADGTPAYSMDLEGLEHVFATEHPRLMILCNPHNPIGLQWSREVLAEVGRLARKYGVKVVSDEIHGDLMLNHAPHIPFADASPDCAAVAITFGAPSKTFNIPGLVSSWCVVKNPELRRPFFEWLEANEFCCPTFVATIGTETAYRCGEPWLEQALQYISDNIDFTEAFLRDNMPEVKMVRPQASFLVWMDFRGLGLSHDELTDLIVNHAKLALNDGAMFGAEGNGFMRFNVATPRCVLADALKRIANALVLMEN